MVHRGKRDLSGRQRDLEKMRQRMIARYEAKTDCEEPLRSI